MNNDTVRSLSNVSDVAVACLVVPFWVESTFTSTVGVVNDVIVVVSGVDDVVAMTSTVTENMVGGNDDEVVGDVVGTF